MSNPVRNSILAGAMAAVLVPAAMAQTASSDASAAPVLEEVMITAQKRTENLQDVPISVQAIDAA
jgi:outer membrane receptor protein involved in Fe transport